MTLLRIYDNAARVHDETICAVWHWRNKSALSGGVERRVAPIQRVRARPSTSAGLRSEL